MNILILNPILYTAERNIIPNVDSIKDTMIYNMCIGFVALGHNITLCAAEEFRPQKREDYDFDVHFFRSDWTHFFPPSLLPFSKDLLHYIKKFHKDFDCILTSEVFAIHSLMASIICPQKTIVWQELTSHQKKMFQVPSKLWYNIIGRWFMKKIIAVVPRSIYAYNFVRNYIPQTSKTIVDHGININKFIYTEKKKRQLISSSQLIHRKNIDGIILKFANLHLEKGYEDIKLLIAGRGNEETYLKQMVKDLGLTDFVDFLGFLPQEKLSEYVRTSLASLVNTRQDLNMVSIPESICSGTPILTNSIPASAEYIKRKQLGIVKDDWGVNELKKIINENFIYVRNCKAYRSQLTNIESAKQLISIFNQYSKKD